MTKPLPSAYKTLRRSLDRATDAGMRERLVGTLRYLERLYGLPRTFPDEDGDISRRKVFCRSPHRLNPRVVHDPLAV